MKSTGLLGGTFDPVHHGHLRLAIECCEQLSLDGVDLVPLFHPPHRDAPVATPDQRLTMLELATRDIACLTIDDHEIHRQGISYTIDTVRYARERAGKAPVCLIIGSDAFNSINTWREWQSIIEYVHIVVAERPGEAVDLVDPDLKKFVREHLVDQTGRLSSQPAGCLYQLTVPFIDTSSTRIRQIILSGKTATSLLPESVIHYIQQNKLYTAN